MADRFDDVVEELRGFREEMRTDRAETRQLGILSQQTEASTQMRTLTQPTQAQTRQINTQTRSIFALADRLEGGGGRSPAT